MDLRHLLENRDRHLAHRPAISIIESLGRLSERWLEKGFVYRKKAVRRLAERSRFSAAMAEALLDALFSELTRRKLTQLLKSELGDPRFLDGFRRNPVTKNLHRAHGPGLITHIFSANVPHPSIVSFVLGMLVKSVNVGKLSSQDPGFLDIYLESLGSVDRKLLSTNCLLNPKNRTVLKNFLEDSDLVVAYGNDSTLSQIRKDVPEGVSFLGYGHRVSFSMLLRESLTKKKCLLLTHRVARDVWMLDQRGCLSPTIVYVQKRGEVSPFLFADCLKKCLKTWTVLFNDTPGHFPLASAQKIIFVRAFDDVSAVYGELIPMKKYLQAVALECDPASRKKIAERLSEFGVNRITHAGRMQTPPITWHHDGRPNLASWLTWTDWEC